MALIFEKTSTRTRCSFEVAAHDMGMGTTYLDPSGSQIGKKKVSKIQQEFSEECLMESSIVDSVRILWRNWQTCRCSGMEWPDERVSSDTDAGGYADDP